MIEFKPLLNDAAVKSDFGENAVAYIAADSDYETARCVFTVDGMSTRIHELKAPCDDPLTVEGLVRSALTYAANRDSFTAYIAAKSVNNECAKVLTSLKFELEGDYYTVDIPDVFIGGCCSNCNK